VHLRLHFLWAYADRSTFYRGNGGQIWGAERHHDKYNHYCYLQWIDLDFYAQTEKVAITLRQLSLRRFYN
jgi:hypothetical protein